MLESQELIETTLDAAGEELNFSGNVIKGIPGSLVYNIQNFDSVYDIDKQDFDFQVSNKQFTNLGLKPGDSFVYNLSNKNYTFEIKSYIDDLTGWFQLTTNLLQVLPSV